MSSKGKYFKQKCKDQLKILEEWDWIGEVAQSKKPSVGEVRTFLRVTHFTCAGIGITAYFVSLSAGEMNEGSANKQ